MMGGDTGRFLCVCETARQKGGSTSVAPERMSVPSSNPESVVLEPRVLGPYSTGVTSTHKDSTAAAGHFKGLQPQLPEPGRAGLR